MIRFSGGGAALKDGRPPPALMMASVVLAAITGLGGLWFIFGRDEVHANPATSSEGQRLVDRGNARSAEMHAAGTKLQQKPVGEGYEFDADGRLVGAAADDSDLPRNRTLAQLSTVDQPDPAEEIRASVRHRGRPTVAAGIRADEDRGERPMRDAADRALLTQSMLAYSKGPVILAKRGQEARAPGKSPVEQDAQEDSRTDERLMNMMERLQEGMLGEPAAATVQAAGPQLYPAMSSPQTFGRGAIGDMRIAQGPGVVVRQGKFLDCALVNHLRVDLAESPVMAMVTRNFLSSEGNHVLVPAGAKLLGTAGTIQSPQQARVYIKFDRVIFPDQRSAYFPVRQVGAVDGAGAVGIPGDVDRHLFLQFGAAIMLGVLDGLGAMVQSPNAARQPTAGDMMLAQTSSNFANILGGVLQRYANVVPTISVPPGTTLKVFFAEDVRMSPYMRSADLSWMR